MHKAYTAIFTRLGLKFRSVVADPGAIGGSGSEEFHVLADSGEDAIAFSDGDNYAANLEMAVALPPATPRGTASAALRRSGHAGRENHRGSHALLQAAGLEAGQDPAGRRSRRWRGGAAGARRSRAQRGQGAEAARRVEPAAHGLERHDHRGPPAPRQASSARWVSRAGSTPTMQWWRSRTSSAAPTGRTRTSPA